MQITELEDSAFGLSRESFAAIFRPFVSSHVAKDDAAWCENIGSRKKKILRKYVKRSVLGWLPAHQRKEELIIDEYTDVWQDTNYGNYSLEVPPPKYSPWIWNEDRMLASAFGGTRVRQYLLARTIEYLQPRSVLEVGCGNGINLLMLSGMFPEIEFTGIELTKAGNRAALHFQQHTEFPEQMRSFSVLSLKDPAAFQRIRFLQGSAADLSFADGEFDLVYTVLALEQMERIRGKALAEIARVAKKNTVMIEPFKDVNNCGWERANVVRRNYFRGRIDDLEKYDLRPMEAIFDFPQEVFLKACAVVSKKVSS